jgi:hypothetical protein
MAKNSTLLWLGGGAVIAYILYSKASAAAAAVAAGVSSAYTGSVNTVSDAMSSLFGPTLNLSSVYYTVTFPDGSRNAIPGNTVDSSGNFTWTGFPAGSQPATQYQIMVGSDGTKYAIAS